MQMEGRGMQMGQGMSVSPIASCNVDKCTYNQQTLCRTPGINVGHHAECDTYFWREEKSGINDLKGAVGACQAAECKFNEQLECKAQNINVAVHNGHADCRTFQQR